MKIPVLDHGFVELRGRMGSDDGIAADAWIDDKQNRDRAKFVRSLYRRGHTSPFEQTVLKVRVRAPIFVVRQWQRHRTWSYNEKSGRLSVMDMRFYLPADEQLRVQSNYEKQGRAEHLPQWKQITCRYLFRSVYILSGCVYVALLRIGLTRELARLVLPPTLYTDFVATVSLHNLFRFLELRLDEHAQWEIQEYARALLEIARYVAPVATAAFEEE